MTNTTSDLHGPTQLDLNPKPPNSVRLSKRAGFLGLGVLGVVGILVFYGIGTRGERQFKLGFHPDEARNVTAATDVGKSIAAKVPARPGTETHEVAKPASGPEELTVPPMSLQPTRQSTPVGSTAPPPVQQYAAQQPPMPPQPTAEDRRRELAWQREQEAMEAPTTAREGFTKGSATGSIAASLPTAQADMTQMTQLLQALQGPGASTAARGAGVVGAGGMPQISVGGESASGAQEYKLQNSQDEKEEFLEQARARKQEAYLGKTRVRPLRKFEIKAGWDIPAVLEQALNSDLPGEIKALVRENVYDTATGKYLLIPQGSRLVGNYSSRVSYGQNGIQVIWDRIVFPDGSSLVLDGMTGQDATGMAGLRDQVDSHYRRLFGMGALTSLFAAAGQLTVNRRSNVFSYPSPQEIAGQSVAQNMSQIGAEATRRNLNVQPTIKVAVGYRFNVRVNRDILFEEPYKPYRM